MQHNKVNGRSFPFMTNFKIKVFYKVVATEEYNDTPTKLQNLFQTLNVGDVLAFQQQLNSTIYKYQLMYQ